MEDLLNKHTPLILVLLCIGAFLVAKNSPVAYMGDSFGSLLTSQVILDQRTIKLDSYMSKGDPPYRTWYQFTKVDGHYYYFFPLGSSFVAIPFVWVENLRGKDMSDFEDHVALENTLSALTMVIATLFVYQICRCFLNPAFSIIFTTTFIFGSSIASTMSTAFWNINISTVIVLWVMLLLSRDYFKQKQLNPYVAGILLWFSFITRPTIVVFIGAVFIYSLMHKGWKFTLKLGISMIIPFIGYLLLSYYEFHQWIIPYYSQDFNFYLDSYFYRLFGVLFSPSRGLFVFHPYLILVIVGIIIGWKDFLKLPLVWLSLFWICALVILVSSYTRWWGGYSYGPRLLTESLPGWLLLSVIVFSAVQKNFGNFAFKGMMVVFTALSVTGIFMHTIQGLYNENTSLWNSTPSVDEHNQYIFDWRYPQFIANPGQLKEKYQNNLLKKLPKFMVNEKITPESENVIFIHFSDIERVGGNREIRWATGDFGRIMFKIDAESIDLNNDIELRLNIYVSCPQVLKIFLDGVKVGEFPVEGEIDETLSVNPRLINFDTPNTLKLAVSSKDEGTEMTCKKNKGKLLGVFSIDLRQE
ncbi:MAG: glycosyltransferase family 39 protein [Chloroflexi bacterium]|nr:glycosyltransferase family 39 protein [Chloroflexota bacterium]